MSFSDASSSPSAEMTRARRSRSASACRDIERRMPSGSAMSLISTRSMLTPQSSVGASMTALSSPLMASRSASNVSRSARPITERIEVCGDLRGGPQVVVDVHDRADRVADPEVHDGVDADRHVVPGDRVLRRHVERPSSGPAPSASGRRTGRSPAGPGRARSGRSRPNRRHDASLVLLDRLHGRAPGDEHQERDHDEDDQERIHVRLLRRRADGFGPVRFVPSCGRTLRVGWQRAEPRLITASA